jgi:acyl-CoA synthetase (NDP forming)
MGFAGPVGAVNPRYDEVLGYPCAPDLSSLPFVPDAIFVGVTRDRVLPVVEEAAALGVKGVVVLAIGFADGGPQGQALQTRITEVARAADVALLGPNCQGLINFHHPHALYMDRVEATRPGAVALMAQSGSVATALTNNKRGVRWSHVVSCGNEAVVDSADLLGYFVDDPHTRVVCAFLETVRDPERFFRECDRARELGKPVIVVKSGRTEAARAAAVAHSGALAMPDRLVDARFRRHGVLRVDTLDELLETAVAMQTRRRPQRPNMAALTASGGQIQLVLDDAASTGLVLPTLGPAASQRLRELLPEFLEASNPLDYWGTEDLERRYPELVAAMAEDPQVDIVVSVGDFTIGPTGPEDRATPQLHAALELADRTDALHVVLDAVGGTAPAEQVERALESDVVVLSGLHEGLRALERLVTFSRPLPSPATEHRIPLAEIAGALSALAGTATSGLPALDLVAALGIPVARSEIARDGAAAAQIAEKLGFPVAVKSADPHLLHKTEAGALALGLADAAAVRAAALRVAGGGPVLVQEQVPAGVEMIVGVQNDAELGAFVLVGLGGIWTEILDDVVIRAAGLRDGEAAEMLRELRGYALLAGARGSDPVDLGAVIEVIERLDQLATAHAGLLESVDLNPVIATPTGVVAVDAVVVPRPAVRETR